MSQDLVTVVVPVYNVEKYLDRCINSIVGQTYRNLDIILIDDGSPDKCPQICDEWAKKDSRIRVVHKNNAGLGMARNTGIEEAKGRYICFFDSDDYIVPKTIELAYAAVSKNRADIVVFGAVTMDELGGVLHKDVPESGVYQDAGVMEHFLPALMGPDDKTGKEKSIPFSAWSCLISMELISRAEWRFVSERDIISEDIYSLLELYGHVRKVVVLEECFYCYCQNGASLTQSYREDRYVQNRTFYLKCLELCKRCGYSKKIERRCMEPFLSNVIGVMSQETIHYPVMRDAVRRLQVIIDDKVLQEVVWEKRKDRTNLKKYLLYWCIRHRCYWCCYFLLAARNAIKGG